MAAYGYKQKREKQGKIIRKSREGMGFAQPSLTIYLLIFTL
jgi:hypothetical protein